MPDNDLGPLAKALSVAQGSFGPVVRDKTVKVTSKSGQSYTFAYAPLDSILNIVRAPLRDNGLVVTQLLDEGSLVTMLLHESGAFLEARTPLPPMTDIQSYGSAVTYVRRYAIQALLGIAAEEDDDGNRSKGNTTADAGRVPGAPRIASDRRDEEPASDRTLPIEFDGKVSFGNGLPTDGQLRIDVNKVPFIGFKVVSHDGKTTIPQVVAKGPIADLLADERTAGRFEEGSTVTVWGDIERVEWKKDGKKMPSFQRLTIARIQTAEVTIPSPVAAPFTAEDGAEVDSLFGAPEAVR